jgi:exopolyphosphatase/guanosine-5'-triphosphate,3'-diphosphate pyrophosphatase
MDIGGGSTEYIIGKQFSYQHLTSTEMGCVSITQRFFSKPEITEKRFNKAISTCQQVLRPHKMKLRHYDWDIAMGASGTIKSVGSILEENNWSQGAITLAGLNQLKQALIEAGTLENVSIAGLKEERLPVLAGGLAILIASFEVLNIEQLNISNNALREGLVFDTLGRLHAEDVRETSVKSVQAWLKIDTNQADAVADTSDRLYKQAHNSWQLHDIDHDLKKIAQLGCPTS